VFNSCPLPDADKGTVVIAALLLENIKLGNPLAPVGQVNGLNRADGRAVAAEGAAVLAVFNYPGQVVIG